MAPLHAVSYGTVLGSKMKSKILKGRRLFRLVLFLGFAGIVFVLFQVISLQVRLCLRLFIFMG